MSHLINYTISSHGYFSKTFDIYKDYQLMFKVNKPFLSFGEYVMKEVNGTVKLRIKKT